MAVQYFRGSFGHVQMGPMMASIMIDIIPIIIVYLVCQKYIIEGVVAGAVKADSGYVEWKSLEEYFFQRLLCYNHKYYRNKTGEL